jgi:cytochrome c oxidase subunit 2
LRTLALSLLQGCAGYQQSALAPAGPQAAEIGRLGTFYTLLLLAVSVLVVLSVLWAVSRSRGQGSTQLPALARDVLPSEQAAGSVRQLDPLSERRKLRAVVVSTVATGVALIVLLTESVVSSNLLAELSTDDALQIHVTGRQWWWQVQYLAADPSQQITTANEIHLPVGRNVRFELESADVIHSFWIPNLHGKRDLIPGRDNVLVLRADRVGRYRSQCAEFCGLSHAHMSLWVVVESAADFARWCAKQRETAHEPASALEREGQSVFLHGPCASCHAISGTAARATLGPDLSHLASRSELAAASMPNRRGYLAGWLLGAQDLKPGSHMPNLLLQASELRALLAYLEALK